MTARRGHLGTARTIAALLLMGTAVVAWYAAPPTTDATATSTRISSDTRFAHAASMPQAKVRAGVGVRNIGGDLRFLDPEFTGFVPDLSFFGIDEGALDAFDLGDAIDGEQVERYVHIAGGVPPYEITTTALEDILIFEGGDDPISNLEFLTLSPAGILSGTYDGFSAIELFFDVQVVDAAGNVLAGIFRLNIIDSGDEDFRFAQDAELPAGQLGLNYVTRIQTIETTTAGENFTTPTSVFYLVPGTLSSGDTLEELGLTLNTDGTLYGRPLQSGTFTFTVRALDEFGLDPDFAALDFDGGGEDMDYSLTVEDMDEAHSTVFTKGLTLRGGLARNGKDSLKWNGVVDLGGRPLADFAGLPITVRVGGGVDQVGNPYGVAVTAIMDGRGSASSSPIDEDDIDDDGDDEEMLYKFKAKLNTKGALKVSISKLDLGGAINAATLNQFETCRVVMNVNVGFRAAADVVEVTPHVTSGPYSMVFRNGENKNSVGMQLPGVSQFAQISGRDFGTNVGARGDSWKFRIFGAPRLGIDGSAISGSGNVSLNFGGDYDPDTAADFSNPYHEADMTLKTDKPIHKFRAKNTDPSRFKQFYLSPPRSLHIAATYGLREDETGLPQAANTTGPIVFQLHYSVGSLNGACSHPIFPFKKKWSSNR